MAKIIDYPRASLRSALQLAEAVDGFAGSCSTELAAEQLGKKMSGAFQALVASAAKYGLIESKAGKLSICPLYRNYKLAYTPEESARHLQDALLSPPLFKDIYERFKGQRLPIAYFEKMLIKEFQVPEDLASRVGGYFIDGAKQVGILSNENHLASGFEPDADDSEVTEVKPSLPVVSTAISQEERSDSYADEDTHKPLSGNALVVEDFWINIRGPGMNFTIEVKDTDDLDIVQVMLRKIERAIKLAETNGA